MITPKVLKRLEKDIKYFNMFLWCQVCGRSKNSAGVNDYSNTPEDHVFKCSECGANQVIAKDEGIRVCYED